MRLIICALLSAGVAIAGLSPAFAQETFRDDPPTQYNVLPYDSMTPVDDEDDDDDDVVEIRPTDCGEFRYWNGEACVDARVVPPVIR